MSKPDSASGQAIDVGCLNDRIAITTDARVQVIGDEKENVLTLAAFFSIRLLPKCSWGTEGKAE